MKSKVVHHKKYGILVKYFLLKKFLGAQNPHETGTKKGPYKKLMKIKVAHHQN